MTEIEKLQYEADRLARLLDGAGNLHGERRDEDVVGAMISIAEDIARDIAKRLDNIERKEAAA